MHPRNMCRAESADLDRHMMNMLYRDFLTHRQSLILKDKWDRNNPRFNTVSRSTRLLGLLCLMCLLILLVVYVSSFAINRNETLGELWLCTCFSWFLLDAFVVNPISVIIFDIVLPRSLYGPIQNIRAVLRKAFLETPSRNDSSHGLSSNQFNSCPFLLSSFRVAQWNKDSIVAQKILLLTSEVPVHHMLEEIKSKLEGNRFDINVPTTRSSVRWWTSLYLRFIKYLDDWTVWYMSQLPYFIRSAIDEACITLVCAGVAMCNFSMQTEFDDLYTIPAFGLVIMGGMYSLYHLYRYHEKAVFPSNEEDGIEEVDTKRHQHEQHKSYHINEDGNNNQDHHSMYPHGGKFTNL